MNKLLVLIFLILTACGIVLEEREHQKNKDFKGLDYEWTPNGPQDKRNSWKSL